MPYSPLSLARDPRALVGIFVAMGIAIFVAGESRSGARSRLAAAAPIMAFLAAWLAFLDYHVDDAGISYAYARNLACGFGLKPFIGAPPVEGFSNPAWTLLLALTTLFRISPPAASKVIQLALAILTLAAVRKIVFRSTDSPFAANTAAALISINASYVLWSAAGLENALLAASLVCAVLFSLDDAKQALPGFALGVASVTRPEGVALAAAFFAGSYISRSPGRRSSLRIAGIVSLAIFIGYQLFRIAYFRELVPNTYFAKVIGLPESRVHRGLLYLGGFVFSTELLLITTLALLGVISRRSRAITYPCALTFLAGAAFAVYSGGDWMREWRFFSHLVPLLAILAGLGTASLIRVAPARPQTVQFATAIFIGLLFVGASIEQASSIAADAVERFCAFADVERTADRLVHLATTFCRDRPLRIASTDIGGLLYKYPSVHTMDLAGLIDRDAARHSGDSSYWSHRLSHGSRPQIIWLHPPWDTITGLSPSELAANGYLSIVRQPHAAQAARSTGFYVDVALCNGAVELISSSSDPVSLR